MLVSRTPVNHATGAADNGSARMQLDCFAATYDGAKDVAAAVVASLDGWSNEVGAVKVTSAHLESEQDGAWEQFPGQEEGIFGVTQDWTFWYYT
jgi:hypothetical protein